MHKKVIGARGASWNQDQDRNSTGENFRFNDVHDIALRGDEKLRALEEGSYMNLKSERESMIHRK